MHLPELSDTPAYFADCCAGLSTSLIQAVVNQLSPPTELVLSVGCGSGLLEALLLRLEPDLNLIGVEVASCPTTHLGEERCLRVASPESLHPEALLASTLMFVYPRSPTLVARYLEMGLRGTLQRVIWLGHQSDRADFEPVLCAAGLTIEPVGEPGIAAHELMLVATVNPAAA